MNVVTLLKIENLLSALQKEFKETFCIMTPDGKLFHGHFNFATDFGTLPIAVKTTHQYFQLRHGDIALLNDPYSGGTTLDSITMVCGLQIEQTSWLLGLRRELPKRISHEVKIDEEGLRIPPTPIGKNFSVSVEILMGIEQHPLCGPQYKEEILITAKRLSQLTKKFAKLCRIFDFTKNVGSQLEYYFLETHRRFQELLQEIPHKEVLLTNKVSEQQEKTDLRLRFEKSNLIFDFSGTSEPQNFGGLTAHATMGICIEATLEFLKWESFVNESIFRCVRVLTPSKSWLDVQYPSPVFWGFNRGAYFISNILRGAFTVLDGSRAKSTSPDGPSYLSFEGTNYKSFVIVPDPRQSLEQSDSKSPTHIRRWSLRKNSGGKGEVEGEQGFIKEWIIDQSLVLKWNIPNTEMRVNGILGGHAGSTAEMYITKMDGSQEFLPKYGTITLEPGTTLTLLTPGHGGIKKPVEKPAEK